MLVLFVSELAACIGRHRYQSVPSATLKVWQRIDPAAVEAAALRVHTTTTVRREDEPLPACVEQKLGPALQSQAAELQESIAAVCKQPLQEVTPALLTAARAAATSTSGDLLALCHTPALSAAGTESVQQAVAAVTACTGPVPDGLLVAALTAATVGHVVTPQQVQGAVYKQRGCQGEAKAVAQYEQKTASKITQRNSKFFKKQLSPLLLLGGRVDGISADGTKLVEVKCRQRRLFDTIPDYERVQLQAYMYVTGIHCCDWVQQYDGETRVRSVAFDPAAWEGMAAAALAFGDTVQALLTDETAQDTLLHETGTQVI